MHSLCFSTHLFRLSIYRNVFMKQSHLMNTTPSIFILKYTFSDNEGTVFPTVIWPRLEFKWSLGFLFCQMSGTLINIMSSLMMFHSAWGWCVSACFSSTFSFYNLISFSFFFLSKSSFIAILISLLHKSILFVSHSVLFKFYSSLPALHQYKMLKFNMDKWCKEEKY